MDYLTGAREEGRLGYAAMAPLAAIFHRLRALPTDSLPPLPSDTLHWPSQRLAQTDPARAQLYRQLIAHVGPLLLTSPTSVLHGDLHSANILTTPSGLRLIDPLPACGPAAFDVARFATDPARGPAVTARLACFAAAGLGTPTELLAWSAVLAGTHLALYLTTLDHPVYQARATAIFDTLVPAAVAL
jgi:streptomycin 6-kinase